MIEYLTLRQMQEVLKTNVVPISRPPTQMSIVKMFFKIPIFSSKSGQRPVTHDLQGCRPAPATRSRIFLLYAAEVPCNISV